MASGRVVLRQKLVVLQQLLHLLQACQPPASNATRSPVRTRLRPCACPTPDSDLNRLSSRKRSPPRPLLQAVGNRWLIRKGGRRLRYSRSRAFEKGVDPGARASARAGESGCPGVSAGREGERRAVGQEGVRIVGDVEAHFWTERGSAAGVLQGEEVVCRAKAAAGKDRQRPFVVVWRRSGKSSEKC